MALTVEKMEELRKQGYYPFVGLFTWSHQDDRKVKSKLSSGITPYLVKGINKEMSFALYCTGARTLVVVGFTNSNTALQLMCSNLIFDMPIEAKIYHAVSVQQLQEIGIPVQSGV